MPQEQNRKVIPKFKFKSPAIFSLNLACLLVEYDSKMVWDGFVMDSGSLCGQPASACK